MTLQESLRLKKKKIKINIKKKKKMKIKIINYQGKFLKISQRNKKYDFKTQAGSSKSLNTNTSNIIIFN